MTNLVALIPLQNLNLGAHQWDIRYGELIEQLRVSIFALFMVIQISADLLSICTISQSSLR